MNNVAQTSKSAVSRVSKPASRTTSNTAPIGKSAIQQVGKLALRWRIVNFSLVVIAAALLLVSLKLPLWQMRMEAPQYRDEEALKIAVHPNAFRGDMQELTVLEGYIGVHIPPTLPQFKWLPGTLFAGAMLGLVAVFLPLAIRRRALIVVVIALITAFGVAAVQAMAQMHDIGHNRDQKTILVGVKDFSPPFLGTTKIAQFDVSSRFGLGAWLIGAALTLQLGAAGLSRNSKIFVAADVSRLKHSTIKKASRLTSTAAP